MIFKFSRLKKARVVLTSGNNCIKLAKENEINNNDYKIRPINNTAKYLYFILETDTEKL